MEEYKGSEKARKQILKFSFEPKMKKNIFVFFP